MVSKKEFTLNQHVMIINAGELSNKTGVILGKSSVDIIDDYIVLLDTPTETNIAVSITESCIKSNEYCTL